MVKFIVGLLLSGLVALQILAQTPQAQLSGGQTPAAEQNPGESKPAEKKAEEGPQSSEKPQATVTAGAIPVTEFPLDKFQDFSAIMHGGPLPGMKVYRYVYRSGDLFRAQSDDSIPNYHVTNLKKRNDHYVTALGCTEMGIGYVRSFPFIAGEPGNKYEVIPVGEEMVDGHKCKVEDLLIHRPKTKQSMTLRFRLYEAEDLQGFPIKIENRREKAYPWVIQYTNVRLGPQDPGLFIYPRKCESTKGWKDLGPKSKSKAAPRKPETSPDTSPK